MGEIVPFPLANRRPACYDDGMPATLVQEVLTHSHPSGADVIEVRLTTNVRVPGKSWDYREHRFAVILRRDGRPVRAHTKNFKSEGSARSAFAATAADPFVAAGYLSGWSR